MELVLLNIYEFDGSVIPGAMSDWFEVYGEDDNVNAVYVSDKLTDVIAYCYNSGDEFTVHTLEAYYKEHGEE